MVVGAFKTMMAADLFMVQMVAGVIGIPMVVVHFMKRMEIHITTIQVMTMIQTQHPHLQTQVQRLLGRCLALD